MISGPKGNLFNPEGAMDSDVREKIKLFMEEINVLKKKVKDLERHVHAYNIYDDGCHGLCKAGETTTPHSSEIR